MAQRSHPAFLRLVHSDNEVVRTAAASGAASSQDSFLPSGHPSTLIFLSWARASLEDLLDIFELSKPKLIFDMRVAPRFDLGRLTRKHFFDLLKKHDCRYVDLFGQMGVGHVKDAIANPALIAAQATGFIKSLRPPNTGPLVFVHDDDAIDDRYLTSIANSLPCGVAPRWQVFRPLAGESKSSPADTYSPGRKNAESVTPIARATLFISHAASPQDNAFVVWLSARLAGAGYDVWSDIGNLNAGDGFWHDIEEVIRLKAAKVIFIQSENVKGKPGPRKEAYLALKVGERNRLTRFVISMKIDGTPFEDTLIELIDLQAIDCRADWLVGLKSLLTVLQRDKVPRSTSVRTDNFEDLVSRATAPVALANVEEVLSSNLLAISDLPPSINFYSIAGVQTNQLPRVASEIGLPAYAHYANVATPATEAQLMSSLTDAGYGHAKIALRAAVLWDDFLAGNSGDLPEWKRRDARNKAFAMFNKAWENHFASKGASFGLLANGKRFWFFKHGHFPDDKVRFYDFSGHPIQRQLVGFSAKRKVYWHFALQARCVLWGGEFLFAVTPHVTFSVDGMTPLASKAQLHSLRRSFCRSWWNDRWRDLLQGFLSAVASTQNTLDLNVGSENALTVDARLQQFISPVSLFVEGKPSDLNLIDDDVADQWDDDPEEELDAEEMSGDDNPDDDLPIRQGD